MIKDFKLILLCILISALIFTTSCMSGNHAKQPLVSKSDDFAARTHSNILSYNITPLSIATTTKSNINLEIPETFNITRPSDKLKTTYDKYFITGTSNPKLPVYFGETEINRIGTKGTFGVLTDLKMGENTFSFSQGGETKTVTITRTAYVSGDMVPISEITQASMVPASFSGVKAGESLDVGCIAPSGAKVTASFDGKTVELKQVDAGKRAGLPVFFRASIVVDGSYDNDITQNAGKVEYSMTYNGKSKKYESSGDVYVAGKKSNVAVRVKSYMGFVYRDTKNLSVFREKLKLGAVDYLRSQDNVYAELASGGYVSKEQLEIIEGRVSVGNKLGKVKSSVSSKSESYAFTCSNKPAYLTSLKDGSFSITFFNTVGSPDINVSNSKLFSGVAVSSGSNYTTYTFTQSNPGKLWGHNVSYSGKEAVLSFQYKPVLRSGSKPFEAITIVLDPGHGGTDKGALGVANITGPSETDVNLAHAYATRDVLASMGANVILTRREDIYYSLDDRLKASEQYKADFFISIHHNSIGENVDANKITGLEVYYHTVDSKVLANSMMSRLSGELGRPNRFVMQSYYRVTLSPYSPAVLLELGYMSNPADYERAATQSQINAVARAVANGIKQTLA